jgi:hypothetical protein
MIFTASDYATLASIVFRPDYPGNATARGVVEAPNGDGHRDRQKSYSHVATKYLDKMLTGGFKLKPFLQRAHREALLFACKRNVPEPFWPSYEYGALRVLEYPVGATSALHTDFDLFTLNLYRNVANDGLPYGEVHMGELGELLGLGHACPHAVRPMNVIQQAIVYFAIPSHDAVLPSGQSVGAWIQDRLARSRYDAK